MENSYEFNDYGGNVDEVYGLYDDENLDYGAPQEPSFIGSDLFYYQTDFVYDPALYVQPSYLVLYPAIPVIYSADYYYYQHVGVYTGYYVPYLPTNLSYVTDIYQVPAYETTWVSSSVEQNSFAYEEYDSGLYTPGNGDSYDRFEEVVGEATTTCHFSYEEDPETLNDDPNEDEVNNNSSNSIVANDVVSTTPDINENTAVQLTEGAEHSTANTNLCVEDDVSFLKSLSAADFNELKSEIDGTYNQLKKNLYNDVTKGYTKMKEFLKNVKWKWDRCLYTIREEENVKKSFDIDFEYYFHDVIRIPKERVKYEDPAEKYILYQMLGSLEMDDLKKFMELNYDNGKKRLYKEECKGHTKIKRQFKKLKWERSSLCRITEGKELKISKNAFVRNFIRGLRNITSEESKDVNYLLDVLKKSVLTSTPESEEIEENINEEDISPDCQLMAEHPELPVSSSDSVEDPIPDTSHISLSNGELDVESQNIIVQLADSSGYIAEDIKCDPVPQKTELSLSEEDSESEKIEEDHTSLSSVVKIGENERPFAPPVIEMDSFCKEDFGVNIIEENHTSLSSVEKIGENERPFAPPVIELDSVSDVSLREEELDAVSLSNTEPPNVDVSSPDMAGEKSSSPPSVTLEPEALAAAAENNHPKKRFSSLRKFLSRICCCRKRPPS